MDYSGFVTTVSTMMGEQDPSNPDFASILPGMIDYAEKRCYRDLDMLQQRFIDSTGSTVANSRTFSLPANIQVLEGLHIVNTGGVRSQAVPTSREFINFAYPTNAITGIPIYFAVVDQFTVFLAPWPDQVYTVEVEGVQFPPSLDGVTVTTTPLTNYAPDIFVAAAMVFASAYQKNFGAQSDNPQTAQSWEQQYQTLIQPAKIWEIRKKFYGEAWSSKGPNPVATPPRV